MLKKNMKNVIIILLLGLSVCLRIQNLWLPIGDDMHAFRQTETAIVIQSYFNDGWSLLRYQMPVLGQPWLILFECPLYQSVVYFVMKVLHQSNIDIWCRIISLCSFYLSAFVLKKTAELIVDKKSVYCICALYLFAPFNILWSRAALIDYMSVLFALIYVWGLYSWLTKDKKTIGITLVFGCLTYLLKATTMFPYVFLLACLIISYFLKQILSQYGEITIYSIYKYIMDNKMRLIILAILCILPIIPGICWTKYADFIKGQSIYTQGLTSEALHNWNYGTMEQKLQISNWKVILRRLIRYMGGKEVVICMGAAYLFIGKKRNLHTIINCGIAVFLTIFSLFNLYYIHDYYMIALTPILSIGYGVVLFIVVDKLFSFKSIGKIVTCAVIVLIMYAQVNKNYEYLKYAIMKGTGGNSGEGKYIESITTQNERILIEGEDWNPTTLYYANRKGLMVKDISEQLFTGFLQQENYTTLVAHSVEDADTLAQYYDVMVQYPGYQEINIYKFYQELPESLIVQEEVIEEVISGSKEINAKDRAINVIKVKYDNITEPVEIDIELTDINENEFHDTINLLANKEEIYYNVAVDCKDVQTIRFDVPESIKISIEY